MIRVPPLPLAAAVALLASSAGVTGRGGSCQQQGEALEPLVRASGLSMLALQVVAGTLRAVLERPHDLEDTGKFVKMNRG
jgi:hypothetical protein